MTSSSLFSTYLSFQSRVRKGLLVLTLFLVSFFSAHGARQMRYHITHFDEDDGLMVSDIQHGFQDSQGLIWFASRDGLLRYDGHRFKTFKAFSGDDCPLESSHIAYIEEHGDDILCLSQGKMYLFSKKTGRFKATDRKFTKHSKDIEYAEWIARINSLPEYQNIGRLKVRLIDNQGGVWVRSNRGFERIEFCPEKLSPQKVGGETAEIIRAFLADRSERIWISDMNGYIRISRRGETSEYLTADGRLSTTRKPFGKNAYSLYEDRKGRIWIGCKPGGLYRLVKDGTRFSVTHYTPDGSASSLSADGIYSIREDSSGRLWVATFGGGVNLLTENADGTVTFRNMNNVMKKYPKEAKKIHGMCITRNDIMILATSNGLYTAAIIDNVGEMTFYRNVRRPADDTSLPTNDINDVIQTKDGKVFVATSGGGLCVTNSDGKDLLSDNIRFTVYNSLGNTATDIFLSLAEDCYGNVWAVGNTSLTKIEGVSGKVENFTKSHFEGMFMFSEAAPLTLAEGTMMIGTTQGVMAFHVNDMRKSAYVPRIAIHCPDTVTLSPDEKSLFVEFSALDFSRHEPVTYAYRMDGMDTEWNYTIDNHVYYSNVPGGRFTLRIRSTNSDGVWTDNERSIVVIRKPAFNETRTAWMLYGVALMVCAGIIWRTTTYIRRLKKESGDYRLKTSEQLQFMTTRIKDLVSNNSDLVSVKQEEMMQECDNGRFVEQAKLFAKEHVGDSSITVDAFADHMNMSSSKLYVLCRKHLGYSPINYLQHVKINYATRLLENSGENPNISDIAYRCGFTDPKYFSRCFKKIKGMSPKEYATTTKKKANGNVLQKEEKDDLEV